MGRAGGGWGGERTKGSGGVGSPLCKQIEFLRPMYVATLFKTLIVNVTHSEWRHITAFLMRGRALCAKLTMRER